MGPVSAWVTYAVCSVALGGALLVTVAGVGHGRDPRVLRVALHAHAVLPVRVRGGVARVLPGIEVLVGASVLVAVLAVPVAAPGPLVAESALYAGFTAYLAVARRRRPGTPCGCFTGDAPAGRAVVVRAGGLAAGAVAAAVLSDHVAALPGTVRPLCLAGGFVTAMLAWLAPELTRL
ncbi:MauE/DoxX family redox-associated membrane protein [Planosporangium sp. 12N6]|uniref:MauE/DoxX family redox-associated membrane protein n=1 Tax=Planosporangium spinosum TaxID=3402278 RepID=UPI003CECD57C